MCGAEAAGPCARCRNPTCGDCSVLTEGGAKLWAICLRCEKRGGKTLAPGWVIVAAWLVGILAVLGGLVALIETYGR
jgi:hypothetical protein